MLTLENLVSVAKSLASDTGENVEYDRALVELVAQFLPGDADNARDYANSIIVKGA